MANFFIWMKNHLLNFCNIIVTIITILSWKQVEFVDIHDQYPAHEDLICKYKFNDYTPQEGDRVAIFKLGWSLVKEYLLFEWAPTDSKDNIHHIVFNSKYLIIY